jgi:hypothetical protein
LLKDRRRAVDTSTERKEADGARRGPLPQRAAPALSHAMKQRTLITAICGLALALAAACAPPPEPPPGWQQAYITRDGADITQVDIAAPDALRVTAPGTNTGTNSRALLWQNAAAPSVDHSTCITAVHSGWPIQEGVALRVTPSPLGDRSGTRGITVQKNVWARADRVYNVHLWDTTPGANGQLSVDVHLSAIDMTGALAGARDDLGRRLCARISGQTLTYKVWPAQLPEPAWDDPVHSRTLTVPADWAHAGQPGLYIGHVGPNGWANLTGRTVGP